MYTIGELSAKTGVKIPTIRYYEQMGLLENPERTQGNQRRYFKPELERLVFIRHSRDLGFSIAAIGELVSLSNNPNMPCDQAHSIAESHLKDIDAKLALLKKLKRELHRITAKHDSGTIGACFVIEALSQHSHCESDHS